ncbi:MAG: hypothetical protein QM638_12185 [Nocardioides sp.]|uniref:hypothetical protein n=1 Tax=Nocardioides sp. TaxID=35761 RepID=UPI0039E3DDCF
MDEIERMEWLPDGSMRMFRTDGTFIDVPKRVLRGAAPSVEPPGAPRTPKKSSRTDNSHLGPAFVPVESFERLPNGGVRMIHVDGTSTDVSATIVRIVETGRGSA